MRDKQAATQAAADRLSAKLQTFYAALPDDEKQVMAAMPRHMATQANVSGQQLTAKTLFEMPDDAGALQ